MLRVLFLCAALLFGGVAEAQEHYVGQSPAVAVQDLNNPPGASAPADDRVYWCEAFTRAHPPAPMEGEAVTLGDDEQGPSTQLTGGGNDMEYCVLDPAIYRRDVLYEEALRNQ